MKNPLWAKFAIRTEMPKANRSESSMLDAAFCAFVLREHWCFLNNALCSSFLLNIGCVLGVLNCLLGSQYALRMMFVPIEDLPSSRSQPHSETHCKVHLVSWRCLFSVVCPHSTSLGSTEEKQKASG